MVEVDLPELQSRRSIDRRLYVELAGATCWLQAETDEVYLALQRLFGRYLVEDRHASASGLEVCQDADGRTEIIVIVNGHVCDPGGILAAPECKRFVRLPYLNRRMFQDTVLGQEAALELAPDRLIVINQRHWQSYVLLTFVWLLQRAYPVVSLHAAVSATNGHVLILLGPSGSGKSTLSAALHEQGANYYGDELAFFNLTDYRLSVWQRPVCLRPGGVELLDRPGFEPTWYQAKPDDPKCVLNLPEPDKPCPQERISFIFMNGFAEKPGLKPMHGGLAVRRLLEGLGCGDPSIPARLDIASDLVNRFPCWRLDVGPPAATAELLFQYARGRG